MDIAFIVSQFPSVSETFVLNQVIGLLHRGHQVDIYAQSRGGAIHPDIQRYRLLERTHYLDCPRNRWTRAIQGARFCFTHLKKNTRAVLGSLNVFRYGRNASSLSLLFATIPFYRKYDIVHCQFGQNGRFGAILKGLGLQKKLVVTFHGVDIRKAVANGSAVYGDLWTEADCLIAISKYNYEHLLRFAANPKKIVYHPVGIDCQRFQYRPSLSPNGRYPIRLLSVARLVKEKGLSYGIRAVHKVMGQRPDLQLRYDIIGEGPLRAELEQLINKLGVEGSVHLVGGKSQDAVIQGLRESDIFVSPSLAEALPVSVMEAQAVGLPVIATQVGSVDQIVLDGRSGWLVPPRNVPALADKLRLVVDHPEQWPGMGAIGRQQVEQHYDIDQLNDRLVGLYQHLLAA
ncbi:MAG: glycosyltransferase [Candidatus Binatia bacterium]